MKIIERCKTTGKTITSKTSIEDFVEDFCGLTEKYKNETTNGRIQNVSSTLSKLISVLTDRGLLDAKDMELIFTNECEYELVPEDEFPTIIE